MVVANPNSYMSSNTCSRDKEEEEEEEEGEEGREGDQYNGEG